MASEFLQPCAITSAQTHREGFRDQPLLDLLPDQPHPPFHIFLPFLSPAFNVCGLPYLPYRSLEQDTRDIDRSGVQVRVVGSSRVPYAQRMSKSDVGASEFNLFRAPLF